MSFYPDKWTMNIWFIVSHKGKIWSSIISEIHHDKESVLCMLWRWGLFPKENKRLKEWMESLSIRDIPPDHARICAGHFLSHEIDIGVTGRRSISHLALPLKESHQHKKSFWFLNSFLKLWHILFPYNKAIEWNSNFKFNKM